MPPSWQKDPSTISTNEKQFIVEALKEECRIDGRRPFDFRKLQVQISLDSSCVTLSLGQTLVQTNMTASLDQPKTERPNEGNLRMNVIYSPMASSEPSNRHNEELTDVQQTLERTMQGTRAVDLEALSVVAGRKAWNMQLDIKVLDSGGNITDAVFLAALAALMAFRRPDVTVIDVGEGAHSKVTVHSTEKREAIPLSLHQGPLAVTFALFEAGESPIVDPSGREESACEGTVTIALNSHGEICLLHKAGGEGLSISQIMRLVKIAGVKVTELSEKLKAALEVHESARVAARVRRKETLPVASNSRNVTVLHSTDVNGVAVEAELGVSLEDLRAAAEIASTSSSDDEEMVIESALPVAIEAGEQVTNHCHSRPADGPSPPAQSSLEGLQLDTDDGKELNERAYTSSRSNTADGVKPRLNQPYSSGLATAQEYLQTAARIAGDRGQTGSGSLQAAIKKKKKKKSGPNV